jgi:hypothetical protein
MTEQEQTTPAPGDEWATWGRQDDGEERWKPSGHVGALVRLVIRGYKEVDTTLGLWQFVEADVTEVRPDGNVITTAEVPLSGTWFVSRFKAAPSGYQALGVITAEQYAKGTGYAMRSLTDDERALMAKALPTY